MRPTYGDGEAFCRGPSKALTKPSADLPECLQVIVASFRQSGTLPLLVRHSIQTSCPSVLQTAQKAMLWTDSLVSPSVPVRVGGM